MPATPAYPTVLTHDAWKKEKGTFDRVFGKPTGIGAALDKAKEAFAKIDWTRFDASKLAQAKSAAEVDKKYADAKAHLLAAWAPFAKALDEVVKAADPVKAAVKGHGDYVDKISKEAGTFKGLVHDRCKFLEDAKVEFDAKAKQAQARAQEAYDKAKAAVTAALATCRREQTKVDDLLKKAASEAPKTRDEITKWEKTRKEKGSNKLAVQECDAKLAKLKAVFAGPVGAYNTFRTTHVGAFKTALAGHPKAAVAELAKSGDRLDVFTKSDAVAKTLEQAQEKFKSLTALLTEIEGKL